ncbi:hypothetical protein MNV49_005307 [Pseudohyphozyma bogoriensis]|nr:hypothetical protein MNV49_005307 [Pseudohyphozyma bogoriensis]
MSSSLPKITQVLELCLYANHLPTSLAFYSNTLALGKPFLSTPRMCGFALGSTTLLLFQRGRTSDDSPYPTPASEREPFVIPGHGVAPSQGDVKLKTHFALAVEKKEEVEVWEEELRKKDVRVLGRVQWPKGGRSVYFEDPDGHVGEIVSRGIWPNY